MLLYIWNLINVLGLMPLTIFSILTCCWLWLMSVLLVTEVCLSCSTLTLGTMSLFFRFAVFPVPDGAFRYLHLEYFLLVVCLIRIWSSRRFDVRTIPTSFKWIDSLNCEIMSQSWSVGWVTIDLLVISRITWLPEWILTTPYTFIFSSRWVYLRLLISGLENKFFLLCL